MDFETRKKIAAIVKRWTDSSKFSQSDLANRFGISRITFSAQINGRKSFPLDRIKDLIELLTPPQDEINKIKELLSESATKKFKISPLLRVGIQVEAERRATNDLIEKKRHAITGDSSNTTEIERLKIEHRAEMLQLKLEHAERENKLLSEVVKQLSEKDELTKKILETNED